MRTRCWPNATAGQKEWRSLFSDRNFSKEGEQDDFFSKNEGTKWLFKGTGEQSDWDKWKNVSFVDWTGKQWSLLLVANRHRSLFSETKEAILSVDIRKHVNHRIWFWEKENNRDLIISQRPALLYRILKYSYECFHKWELKQLCISIAESNAHLLIVFLTKRFLKISEIR